MAMRRSRSRATSALNTSSCSLCVARLGVLRANSAFGRVSFGSESSHNDKMSRSCGSSVIVWSSYARFVSTRKGRPLFPRFTFLTVDNVLLKAAPRPQWLAGCGIFTILEE